MALQRRDVGADRNIAAVLGATLVDLQPAPVAELRLEGTGALRLLFAEDDLRVNQGRRSALHDLDIRGADPDSFGR